MTPVADVVARLLVDAGARRALHSAPEKLAAAYRLSAKDLEHLVALDAGALEFAAGAVGRKRLARLSDAYPWTVTALRLAPPGGTLTTFLADHPPIAGGERSSALTAERERFRRFVTGMARTPKLAFVGDLLRFEETKRRLFSGSLTDMAPQLARTATPPRDRLLQLHPRLGEHTALEHLEWDVMLMGAGLGSSPPKLRPTRGPVWLLLCRQEPERSVSVYRMSPPSASVLLLCDGRRSVEEIVGAAHGRRAMRREMVLATVERGCATGALLLERPR